MSGLVERTAPFPLFRPMSVNEQLLRLVVVEYVEVSVSGFIYTIELDRVTCEEEEDVTVIESKMSVPSELQNKG